MFLLYKKELSKYERDYVNMANCSCSACLEQRDFLLLKIEPNRLNFVKKLRWEKCVY